MLNIFPASQQGIDCVPSFVLRWKLYDANGYEVMQATSDMWVECV